MSPKTKHLADTHGFLLKNILFANLHPLRNAHFMRLNRENVCIPFFSFSTYLFAFPASANRQTLQMNVRHCCQPCGVCVCDLSSYRITYDLAIGRSIHGDAVRWCQSIVNSMNSKLVTMMLKWILNQSNRVENPFSHSKFSTDSNAVDGTGPAEQMGNIDIFLSLPSFCTIRLTLPRLAIWLEM